MCQCCRGDYLMNMPSAVKTVGVIGAGRMGQPIIGHIVRKGFTAIVHDIDAGKRERVEAGGRWADSSRGAGARVPRRFSSASATTGRCAISCRRAACCLAWRATQSWPCSRRSTRAPCRSSPGSQRSLGCMWWIPRCAAGAVPRTKARCWPSSAATADVVERLRPVLACFSTDIVHTGGVGTAQVAKAANNMVMWACLVANHEALALAKRSGVDVELLRAALSRPAPTTTRCATGA